MRTSKALALILTSILLAGCSSLEPYLPSWMEPSSTQVAQTTGNTPSPKEEEISQKMGARVRDQIAKASARGVDTRMALKYQVKGDQALNNHNYLYAAEQ